MEDIIESKEVGDYTVKVLKSEDPVNPREDYEQYDNMICFHGRYSLGDEESKDFNPDDFNGWDELEDNIVKKMNWVAYLPLYLYDHSGITISTESFNDRWDSGQVGFIGMSRQQMKEIFDWSNVTEKRMGRLLELLKSSVDVYDDYLTGNIYDFVIVDKDDCVVESCCNYIGDPENALADGVSMAESLMDNKIDM